MNPTKKMTILMVVVLILCIFVFFQNAQLKDHLNTLEMRLSKYQSELATTIDRIDQSIQQAFSDQNNQIDSYSYTYLDVDEATNMVNVELYVQLKERSANSEIILKQQTSQGTGSSYKPKQVDGIHYTYEMELSWKNDYVFDAYETTPQGDFKKLNTDPIFCSIASDYENRMVLTSGGFGTGEDFCEATFSLENKTFGVEGNRIERVEWVLMSKDHQVLYTEDVTDQNIVNGGEILTQTDNTATTSLKPQYGAIQIDEQGVERAYFQSTHQFEKPFADSLLPAYIRVEVELQNGEHITLS